MFRKIEQTWLVISINNIIILLLLRTFSHVFEIISQTFFFCLTLKKTCVWSHCGERFAVQRINRTLLPLWVVVFFFSFETMENGFKSHVSYFTLWQVLQASPYKWWLLKVRGIRKRQIACSPCLSFFFFFLIAGVLNLLPALLLLMRFFFRVRFTLKVRAVKSQSALPCDTHIFLLLLLLIVPPPPHIFFFLQQLRPKSVEVNGIPLGLRTSQGPKDIQYLRSQVEDFSHTYEHTYTQFPKSKRPKKVKSEQSLWRGSFYNIETYMPPESLPPTIPMMF